MSRMRSSVGGEGHRGEGLKQGMVKIQILPGLTP